MQMRLPRFGTKSLLIAITVTALWLSTLTGFTGSNDVQAFIWTAIVIASGVAAATLKGKRRAFWAGFCGTMLLTSMRTVFSVYGAKLSWTNEASRKLAIAWHDGTPVRGQVVLNINATLIFLTLLASALAIGFLAALVFDHCRDSKDS